MDSYNFGNLFSLPVNAFLKSVEIGNQLENQQYQRWVDEQNRKMQYDFAQNSIKWRVNDAKQSGIHPLAALGISPSSAQPIYSSSESVRMPNFNFGELFSAQIDLLESEAEKNKAEASAIIAGQTETQLDPSNPSGVVKKTLANPEPTARATENPAEKGIVKSYRIEPTQQEIDKYESLGVLGMLQYVQDYHFNGYENLQRAKPKIEDNLRKMAKKQGLDYDMEFSLVIRGDNVRGYTLDLIPHKNIDDYISPLDKNSKTTKPPKYRDKFLESVKKRGY